MLRPGEVAIRMDPWSMKDPASLDRALADAMRRARTGELRPGDRIGTVNGEVAIGKPGDGLTKRQKAVIRALQIEGLAPWD